MKQSSYRSCCTYLFAVSISEKTLRKPWFNYRSAWTCTRLPALREHIALTFKSSKTCACVQDMSRRILRQVRMRATECGCVQRCFSKLCIFRPVAARAERKVPRYSVLNVLKHGREIEGNHAQVPPLSSAH